MISPSFETMLHLGLRIAGRHDPSRPRSYREGADTPATIPIPVIPRQANPLSAQALDLAAEEALGAQVPTPADHEPGLMEDLAGLALTPANIEQVFDELVRPALNADGGDISLVKIDGGDVYVRLVGACNTCPSAVMTMKMGVERLLQDEFPEMGELIQVDAGF